MNKRIVADAGLNGTLTQTASGQFRGSRRNQKTGSRRVEQKTFYGQVEKAISDWSKWAGKTAKLPFEVSRAGEGDETAEDAPSSADEPQPSRPDAPDPVEHKKGVIAISGKNTLRGLGDGNYEIEGNCSGGGVSARFTCADGDIAAKGLLGSWVSLLGRGVSAQETCERLSFELVKPPLGRRKDEPEEAPEAAEVRAEDGHAAPSQPANDAIAAALSPSGDGRVYVFSVNGVPAGVYTSKASADAAVGVADGVSKALGLNTSIKFFPVKILG